MTQEALKLALDKKADNARELGLDYEPENTLYWYALNYRTAPTQNAQAMFEALEKFVEAAIKEALARPGQEPVGYADKTTIKYLQEGLIRKAALVSKDEAMLEGEDADIPLYTTPPQRKPLSEEKIKKLWLVYRAALPRYLCFARGLEQAHDIKEKK